MNICYICIEYPPMTDVFGGIGIAFQTEAEWFARNGYNVSVVTQTSKFDAGNYEHNDVKIYNVPTCKIAKIGSLINRLYLAYAARKTLGNRPGIVVTHDYTGPIVSKPFKQPLVVQLHGCASLNAKRQYRKGNWQLRLYEERTLKLADAIRSVSENVSVDTLKLFDITKNLGIITLHNPIDLTLFRPYSEQNDPHQIIFVGKLNKLKGVLVLAEVIGEICETIPSVSFVFVGHDAIEDGVSVKHQMLRLIPSKFHQNISFLGRLPHSQIVDCLDQAGIFVLPSYTEAFPLVILEAMACGKPVVASDRGGIPEIVIHGKTGLLADPENPSTFLTALVELLSNPDYAKQLGKAGRLIVEEKYSEDLIFQRLSEFYSKISDYQYA